MIRKICDIIILEKVVCQNTFTYHYWKQNETLLRASISSEPFTYDKKLVLNNDSSSSMMLADSNEIKDDWETKSKIDFVECVISQQGDDDDEESEDPIISLPKSPS